MKLMADHYGMSFDQAETFIDIISAMDDEVINAFDSKEDQKSAKPNKSGKPG